ncbi:MAG: ribonuclease HII [Acidilobaceae archaeon]
MSRNYPSLIGVDEAGRGSLIGDIVIAAISIKPSDIERLVELGVRDSKKLNPHKRAYLYTILKKWPFSVYSIQPADIDKYNISMLEEYAVYEVLKNLARIIGREFTGSRIVIDKFGPTRILSSKLRDLGFKGEFIVAEKADMNYIEVAAASIIAKYIRDRRIQVLKSIYGFEGSGYPSDPRTINWVRRALNQGLKPPIIRYSWSTIAHMGFRVEKKNMRIIHKTLDEYLEKGIKGENRIY